MQGPEEKETAVRKAPATRIKPSAALLIEGFKRPFTDKAAAALLSEHGEPGSIHSLCCAKEPRLVSPHIHLPGAYQQGLHGLSDKTRRCCVLSNQPGVLILQQMVNPQEHRCCKLQPSSSRQSLWRHSSTSPGHPMAANGCLPDMLLHCTHTSSHAPHRRLSTRNSSQGASSSRECLQPRSGAP